MQTGSAEEERSFFLSFIENQLSTPNRQIRIRGIEGVLSSRASIEEITVADRDGVWLSISGARIDWSRSALILQQRLEISSLTAESIEVRRRPTSPRGLPSPEARSFSVPEFPLAITLEHLEVPSITFGEEVFGLSSTLSFEGRLNLEGGSLDTALEIDRIDGPGGRLSLETLFDKEANQLDLDVALSEPEDGVVVNLLKIENRPPIELALTGAGPVENLDLSLALSAAGEPALSGTAQLRQQPEGIGVALNVGGPIVRLVPEQFRGFFGADTRLEAAGLSKSGGGFILESLSLQSAAFELEAMAETAVDGFLSQLSLQARIADPSGTQVLLPISGGKTFVERADLSIEFGGGGSDEWSAVLAINDLDAGDISAQRVSFDLSGIAAGLTEPDERRIQFAAEGMIAGIAAQNAEAAEALGESVQVDASGNWRAGEPLTLERINLSGDHFSARLAGTVAELAFDGEIGLQTSSIAPFSGIVGRDLGGSLDLQANGEIRPISGAFDVTVDGTANNLRLDLPSADPLFEGRTRISGRLARSAEGFAAEDFAIESERAVLSSDGTVASEAADISFQATIVDLAHLTDRADGRLSLEGRATGSMGNLAIALDGRIPRGRLLDKELTEATLAFNGVLQDDVLIGDLRGDAFLSGTRANLLADIRLAEDKRQLSNLTFTTQGARLTGDVSQGRNGLLEGDLMLDAVDISAAAALLLREARGSVNARLAFDQTGGEQELRVNADVNGLMVEQISLQSGELQAEISDLFGVPAVTGTLNASGASIAGIEITTLEATAEASQGATTFSGDALLDNGTEIHTRGQLMPENGGYTVSLQDAELVQSGLSARLLRPARLTVQDDLIAFRSLEIDLAGGRLQAEGEIGQALNVALTLEATPLSVANAIRPDLALGGFVDGEALVTGTRDAPRVSFNLTGREIVAAFLRQAGVSSLAFEATGSTVNSTLSLNARMDSPDGLSAMLGGDVPLGDGELALDVDIQSFPLSILNRRFPELDLGGTVTGTGRLTGSLADPFATFTAEAAGLTARPLARFGAEPLRVTAEGQFEGEEIVLDSVTATGPAGLSVTGSGRVPIATSGLSVDAQGTVPLILANRLAEDRGTQFAGTLMADLHFGGRLANPEISGSFAVSGATAIDPLTNLRLTGVAIDAGISRNVISIRSGSATFARGGTIGISGTVSLDAAAGFPADLAAEINQMRYSDGEMVTATLDARLRLAGSLLRDPLLSGNVGIDRAEILVPESFGGGPAAIDIQHIAPPAHVARTLTRARAEDGTPMPSARPSIVRLDLNVEAPARVFVRGRGLDAELGGSLLITGPITSVQPTGGFRLIRGRLNILGQRITFDEGIVTAIGDLDPFVEFVARSERSDIIVMITVSGRVSDLSVNFSSQPELPEDEVLARLIFDRGVEELSPLQLAQLASAAAELAGGSNGSLLGTLRDAIGLDELDVIADPEGGAGVRAGRYIQENVYLGVEAGGAGRTRATINLDLSENLKVRGGVGTEGDTDLGIFFERDY